MPVVNDMTIKVGGEAGQGVESGGAGFARAVMRAGLHCFGLQDYMSRIRGGHNFYQIRTSDHEVCTFATRCTCCSPFNRRRSISTGTSSSRAAASSTTPRSRFPPTGLPDRGVRDFSMPLTKIAEQEGGHKIMMNTAAIGAMAGLTEFRFESIADVIESNFKRKGGDTVKNNLKVAEVRLRAGPGAVRRRLPLEARGAARAPQRMLMNGNQAIAMGALAAGCRFISTYPMTPASTITEWLAAHAASSASSRSRPRTRSPRS